MSYEDRPTGIDNDEAAALFMHTGALLDTVGLEGYSGTFELPLTIKAITTLHAHEALMLSTFISESLAHKPLSLELGYIDTAKKLGVMSLSLPTTPEPKSSVEALVFERSEKTKFFLPFARTSIGRYIELDDIPVVTDKYVEDVLFAAKHPLPDFPANPAKLKLSMSDFIAKAPTYVVHREQEFTVDPYRSVRVTGSVNRFYDQPSGTRKDVNRAKTKRKLKAGRASASSPVAGFRHEEFMTIEFTEFDEITTPAQPVVTKSLTFHATDHSVVDMTLREEYAADTDSRVTVAINNPKSSVLAEFHDELAEYEIGGIRPLSRR